jgi:hypothetical protein
MKIGKWCAAAVVILLTLPFRSEGQKRTELQARESSDNYFVGAKQKTGHEWKWVRRHLFPRKWRYPKTRVLYYGLYAKNDAKGLNPLMKFRSFSSSSYSYSYYPKGLCRVGLGNSKQGILDLATGKMIIAPEYSTIRFVPDAKVFVANGKQGMLFDSTGHQVNTVNYSRIATAGSGFYDAVQTGKNAVVYNKDNAVVVDFGPVKISDAINGTMFIIEKGDRMGIMDIQKNIRLPFDYGEIYLEETNNEEIVITSKKVNGTSQLGLVYADEDTVFVQLENKYTYLTRFYEGAMIGEKRARYYVIDQQGKGLVLDEEKNKILEVGGAPEFSDLYLTGDRYLSLFKQFVDWKADIYDLSGKLLCRDVIPDFTPCRLKSGSYHIFGNEETGNSYVINDSTYTVQMLEDQVYDCKGYGDNITMWTGENYSYIMRKTRSGPPFLYKERPIREPDEINNFGNKDIAALFSSEGEGFSFFYDIRNDSVISFTKDGAASLRTYLKYISNEMNSILGSQQGNAEVTIDHGNDIEVTKKENGSYSYTTKSGIKLMPDLPVQLNFGTADFGNKKLVYATLGIETYNEDCSITVVFDEHMRLLKPFSPGVLSNGSNTGKDVVLELMFREDSTQLYSVNEKRYLYNKQLPQYMQRHVEYEKLFNPYGLVAYVNSGWGMIDYSGKVIVPFAYADMLSQDSTHVTFYNGNYCHLLLPANKMIKSGKEEGAFSFPGTYCFVDRNATGKYGIYDTRTAQLVFPYEADEVGESPKARFIFVKIGEQYGIFDLSAQKLVVEVKFSGEELKKTMEEEKYGEKLH